MRLIDADEYANRVIEHMTTPWDRAKTNISHDYDKGLYDAALLLRAMPTIHPEPQWIPCSERLPSAQPEQRKGKWIDYEDGHHVKPDEFGLIARECYCDQCREQLIGSGGVHVYGNFCPNCGADMRGEANGN